MIFMWFYNWILRLQGVRWPNWVQCRSKQPLPTAASDFSLNDSYSTDPPPTKWKRKKSVPSSRQRLLLMFGLINSVALGSASPFELSSDLSHLSTLRRMRSCQGELRTNKLNNHDLAIVQRHLRESGDQFLHAIGHNNNVFSAIVDTGCSHSATNTFSDVDPQSIRKLDKPITLDGIAGGLIINYIGKANWETLDDLGNIVPFSENVLIHEELPNRLLSPQAFLGHNPDGSRAGHVSDHLRIYHDRSEWHLSGRKLLTMGYDRTFLPRLTLFSKGEAQTTLQALTSVLHSTNHNLSALQKVWLRWHIRLGHIGFSHVQKLGLGGFLDRLGLGLQRNKVCTHPLCAACQYGKQTRTPDGTTTTTKVPSKVGGLKKEMLKPGDLIFCDQLESRVPGRLLHTAGREHERDQFCGSTIFCDAASQYIHLEHQVTLNASDTILSKDNFERTGLQYGVVIDSYHTDNGIFKSKRFLQEIYDNSQSIRFSGVGAKWQNGVAEGAIRIIVSNARTMMIHAALHWPEVEDKSLWPLALSHAAYLYNHTPNEITGQAPIEVFSRTLSDGQALRNAHPWGCPAYVLEPRLTEAGGKIPKWQPRSRRGQYVGVSPVHAESVGLVRNLKSGYISPQFHLVYDDWFETVHSSPDVEPPEWDHLCTFQRFETSFDEDTAPCLSDEWLTPDEQVTNAARRRLHVLRQGRKTWQDSPTREARDDFKYQPPNPGPLPSLPQRRPREPSLSLPSTWTRETEDSSLLSPPSLPPDNPEHTTPPAPAPPSAPPPSRRYPKRSTEPRTFLNPSWKGKTYKYAKSSMLAMLLGATCGITPASSHLMQAQVLGYDPHTGFQESLPPGLIQSPLALKAKASKDPDLPSLKESLTGPHSEEFWKAMDAEIASLESKDTWEVVDRSSMPPGTKAVPGTWAQRIKRLPNGELNKFKSRWCCRGDLQSYDGVAYSPLVGWPTVRSALLFASAHGWKSRQVDFTLAFCQSPQPADKPLYMELPQYYRPAGCESRDVVLRMKKSIYGQVDSPKLFYEHLCRGMHKLGFQSSESDPCLFIHSQHKIMVLNYCDDQIWLSPDNSLIEQYVDKLKGLGYDLTLEANGDIFGFLGINFHQEGSNIHLTQTGLIDKVINYTGMKNATTRDTPAATEPLGADSKGDPFSEESNYSAAVGMLLYLASNTRPDIQFAVHQVARFSHSPKKSHGQAIKRIVRYLLLTRTNGISFQPDLQQGLDCYVDADFSGLYGYEDEQDPVSVKSRTGFVLTLFGCPILWSSKLQTDICLSSTAAEYVAFSMAMRELLPMRVLLQEIGDKMGLPFIQQSLVRSTVFEDNQGCLSLVNVPKMSPRNKYLALKYHFFRSHIGEDKGIVAKYIPTLEQKADIFTKGLPPSQFQSIRKLLMGW